MFYVYPHKVSLIKIPHYILIIKIWSLRFKLVNCLQIWVCWFFLYYIPNLPTLLVHQSCVDLQIEFCSMNQLQFETIHEFVDLIMHHVPAVNFIYRQDNHILSHFFLQFFTALWFTACHKIPVLLIVFLKRNLMSNVPEVKCT